MKNSERKNKTVLAFGTFDLFHPGHEYYLSEAKKYGDTLVVIIARDETVKKIKNKSPRQDEESRRQSVENFSSVDRAVLGNLEDHYKVLEEYNPDVLCFGYDQRSFNNEKLEKYLKDIELTPEIHIIPPYHPEKYKSSKM